MQTLDCAVRFPKHRLLGLKRYIKNFVLAAILPDLAEPTPSVGILQEIPVGVDQALIARIGQLFPNLTVIRSRISFKHESLLVSIWEFCPNITELMLWLKADDDESE